MLFGEALHQILIQSLYFCLVSSRDRSNDYSFNVDKDLKSRFPDSSYSQSKATVRRAQASRHIHFVNSVCS